jgi:glutathione S-transferase
MTTPLRLHYAPDNASLCIRLALEELGLPYATVLVDRAVRAQKSPAYLALNPNGLIPVLETADGPLFETGAILLWLADTYGGLMPGPTDPGRGAALKWLFWLSNTLHATERMLFYPGQYTNGGPVMERAILTRTKARLTDQFAILAQAQDADWLDSDVPSALACYLAPLLRWPVFYGDEPGWLDLSQWPRLLIFAQRFEQRPAAVTAAQAEGLGPTPFSAPLALNPLGIGPTDP